MKKLLVGGIVLTGVLIGWGCGKTEPSIVPPEAPKIAEAVKSPVMPHTITDAEVGKKVTCPVMGTPITVDKNTLSAEYNGKVYYFCCGGCPDEFKADPDKFAK